MTAMSRLSTLRRQLAPAQTKAATAVSSALGVQPPLPPMNLGGDVPNGIQVKPITGTFGARVENVDLVNISAEDLQVVRNAVTAYKVLVVDGQDHMTAEQLLAFSQNWGPVETFDHPNHNQVEGVPGVYIVRPAMKKDGSRNRYPHGPQYGSTSNWHADGTRSEHAQVFTFLLARDVPEAGRDTMFADMEAAYERLSPSLREWLETLTATHSWGTQWPSMKPNEHPVISVCKDTGRKAVFVNNAYTRKINGLRKEESDWLLQYLYNQANVPELQVRAPWKRGTMVIWDNQRVQHYAVRDHEYDRWLIRCMAWPDGLSLQEHGMDKNRPGGAPQATFSKEWQPIGSVKHEVMWKA